MAKSLNLDSRRQAVDLALGMVLAFLLVILNLTVNFAEGGFEFFTTHARFPLTAVLLNVLLFWFTVLLWMAFINWRAATRRRTDLEAVVSGISPDVLLVVAPDRRILMCNDSVHRLFGYEPAEVTGQSTDILYSDRRSRGDHPHEIYDALERDGFHIGQATGTRRNGETFPLEIITGDIRGRAGAVLLLRDITYRIRAEEHRRTLEVQSRQQQKMESLGLLAGGIAHDFNNLLGAILGNADLALQDLPVASPVRANVEQVLQAGRRAADLCRELVAYSGQGRFQVEPVHLSQLVRDMTNFLSASLPKKIIVTYEMADDLPLIEADATQLRQVLLNLMTRSAGAIGDGDGAITVSTGTVDSGRHAAPQGAYDTPLAAGRYVLLRVADSGPALSAEARERLFDPFYDGVQGAQGLDLAAVQGIVRAHRGSLAVSAGERERGTAVSILFPAMAEADAADETAWRGSGHALVVDDEAAIRNLASAMLARCGFEVLTAADGEEALAVLEGNPDTIRLVVLDLTMPRMSGEEALSHIRARAPQVPVLLSSGYEESRIAALVADMPGVGYIQKPYTLNALMEGVRRMVPA
jgi:two-component system, cell cycle sensor histidine kinase and response regulator CckA